jgi:hypothetical protein
VRQGFFEKDSEDDKGRTYRLRWLPEQPLNEREENYAKFVKYLIAVGRINETTPTQPP